jgi:hypothetical protein
MARAFEKKWDWDMAFVLYCAGHTHDQILSHPNFRGCPKGTLVNKCSRDDWPGRRASLARLPSNNGVDIAAKELADRLRKEGLTHQEFMLTELERERNIFARRPKEMKTQEDRLDSLKKLDDMARRISGLDEQKPEDQNTRGFAVLVHLQTHQHGPLNPPLPTPSATITLPDDSEHSTGILRSNNAIPDDDETPETTPGRAEMPKPGSLFGATPIEP